MYISFIMQYTFIIIQPFSVVYFLTYGYLKIPYFLLFYHVFLSRLVLFLTLLNIMQHRKHIYICTISVFWIYIYALYILTGLCELTAFLSFSLPASKIFLCIYHENFFIIHLYEQTFGEVKYTTSMETRSYFMSHT